MCDVVHTDLESRKVKALGQCPDADEAQKFSFFDFSSHRFGL